MARQHFATVCSQRYTFLRCHYMVIVGSEALTIHNFIYGKSKNVYLSSSPSSSSTSLLSLSFLRKPIESELKQWEMSFAWHTLSLSLYTTCRYTARSFLFCCVASIRLTLSVYFHVYIQQIDPTMALLIPKNIVQNVYMVHGSARLYLFDWKQ